MSDKKRFVVAFTCAAPSCGGMAIASEWETYKEAEKDLLTTLKAGRLTAKCNLCGRSYVYQPHSDRPFIQDTESEDPHARVQAF